MIYIEDPYHDLDVRASRSKLVVRSDRSHLARLGRLGGGKSLVEVEIRKN